ncbi:S-adenosyl-L-methionine transmembrane transporter [Aureococcus anophagefferens]|uniref:S-adenosyl-L-methionine transmembrane transporter n=1 Tax=Aureococcus anophagefferens TaxID=44056 RepID=A0ABR1FXR6_AURAN
MRLVVLAALAFAAADARVASSRASRAVVAVDGKSWRSQMTFTDRMAAGSGARAVAQTCLHPIDVMRTRLQAKSITSALTPRTFLKGITPQFALAIPAGALQFTCYEWAKERFARRHMTGALPEIRRLMTGGAGAHRRAFAAVVHEEGAAALMKGVVPRVAFLAPLAAITLSLYETFGKASLARLAEIPGPPLASRRFDARAFPRDGAIETASTPGAALDVAARDDAAAAVKLRS